MIAIFLLALTAGAAVARDAVTVDPGSGSITDLSGTDLTNSYCQVSGKTADQPVIESNYAGTLFQCQARCSRRNDCLSCFHSDERICTLYTEAGDPDVTQGGFYLRRLKKNADCPAGSEKYEPPADAYSNTFCMLWGHNCKGVGYYQKPANIPDMNDCLVKCARVKSCSMVNFDKTTGKCEPLVGTPCADEDLEEVATMQNFLRLPLGETECPSNRGPPAATPPPPTEEPEVLPPEPTEEPETIPEPENVDCGGKKYVNRVWGNKGQSVVEAECNAGCAMTVCHCRPWGRCDGAKFTSGGKCRVQMKTTMKNAKRSKIMAHIKCAPKSSVKTYYVSSQTPGERLTCGEGFRLGDCTFFAFRRNRYTKSRPGRGKKGQSGCGVRQHGKGCSKVGRCTSTGVCFKKL